MRRKLKLELIIDGKNFNSIKVILDTRFGCSDGKYRPSLSSRLWVWITNLIQSWELSRNYSFNSFPRSSYFLTELATRTHNFKVRDEGVYHMNNRLLCSKLSVLKEKPFMKLWRKYQKNLHFTKGKKSSTWSYFLYVIYLYFSDVNF